MNILGVDIGGSGIKGAPIDLKSGKLTMERYRIETPRPATPSAVAKTLATLIEHFEWTETIGCGFPAVIQNGVVTTASNIDKKWIGTDAQTLFSKTTGCETHVINDADAAGLAEVEFGAGKDNNGVVLLITIGTGLGSALFNKGELVPNTEFGHVLINDKLAEDYAADSVRKKKDLSWKKWGNRFNQYLQYMEHLLSPDLIILGGGASKKMDKFENYLDTKASIVPAKLLNDAGAIGAALYAYQQKAK